MQNRHRDPSTDQAGPRRSRRIRPARRLWHRLSLLLIITGAVLMLIPPAQRAMAVYSQWQLERRFETGSSSWQMPVIGQPDGGETGPGASGDFDPAGDEFMSAGDLNPTLMERTLSYFWEEPTLDVPDEVISWSARHRPDPEVLGDFPGALIRIPKLDLRAIVLYGTRWRSLTQGPGFYEVASLPGEPGNVAIAGHRTTYGAWFRHVDRLEPGDVIEVVFLGVEYRYEVQRVWVIESNDWSVIAPTREPSLTLTTCHPPGSAEFRLAVRARLVETRDVIAPQRPD